MSRPGGNAGRDALKFGELVAVRRTTTPSQANAAASMRRSRIRRCRDWTGAAYTGSRETNRHGQGTVRTTNVALVEAAAAKAEAVRKFAAGNGVRVQIPVIPRSLGGGSSLAAEPHGSGFLESVHQVVDIAAVFAAGLWGWYHYFRGRTFRARLEVSVDGALVRIGPNVYVVATAALHNVGLGKVTVARDGTGIAFSAFDGQPLATVILWTPVGTVDVFANDQWVEPGETLSDQIMLKVPDDTVAVRAQLRVVCGALTWRAERIMTEEQKPTAVTSR
jgi:hypothetical protein